MKSKLELLNLLERIFKGEVEISNFERAGDDTSAVLEVTAEGQVVCFSVDDTPELRNVKGGQFHVVPAAVNDDESVNDFANSLQLAN